MTLPRITAASYEIDLFPMTREATMRGRYTLVNKFNQPITELHFVLDDDYDYEINLPGARQDQDDKVHHYRIYKIDPPFNPARRANSDSPVRPSRMAFGTASNELVSFRTAASSITAWRLSSAISRARNSVIVTTGGNTAWRKRSDA